MASLYWRLRKNRECPFELDWTHIWRSYLKPRNLRGGFTFKNSLVVGMLRQLDVEISWDSTDKIFIFFVLISNFIPYSMIYTELR